MLFNILLFSHLLNKLNKNTLVLVAKANGLRSINNNNRGKGLKTG